MKQLLLSVLVLSLVTVLSMYFGKRSRKTETSINSEPHALNQVDESVIHQLEKILKGCTICPVGNPQNQQELTKLWRDAYQQGQKEGFHPIILQVESGLLDSMNASAWKNRSMLLQYQS